LRVEPGTGSAEAIRFWLKSKRRDSARYVAENTVVLIEPQSGRVVWPSRYNV
jgi:hypothetical protein